MSTRIRRIAPGVYETCDLVDKDLRPYRIEREAPAVNGDPTLWLLLDSRGREISDHPTLRDAADSIGWA